MRAIDPRLGGRDAYGAEISVHAGKRVWKRLIQPGYSFLVSNDSRAHFGLGQIDGIDRIEVIWPDGVIEAFSGGQRDRHVTLRRGTGARP